MKLIEFYFQDHCDSPTGIFASQILNELKWDVAASASAACHTEASKSCISAILLAMKVLQIDDRLWHG